MFANRCRLLFALQSLSRRYQRQISSAVRGEKTAPHTPGFITFLTDFETCVKSVRHFCSHDTGHSFYPIAFRFHHPKRIDSLQKCSVLIETWEHFVCLIATFLKRVVTFDVASRQIRQNEVRSHSETLSHRYKNHTVGLIICTTIKTEIRRSDWSLAAV